ncbi:MAG: cytochrome C [Betaproteobacteria bacterium]
MVSTRIAVASAALWAAVAGAQGSDPTIARDIAASCSNCHGTNGASVGQVAPLAGAQRADIIVKMQEFKSGKRPGTIMPQLSKGYTDDQIEVAATWFALQSAPRK